MNSYIQAARQKKIASEDHNEKKYVLLYIKCNAATQKIIWWL